MYATPLWNWPSWFLQAITSLSVFPSNWPPPGTDAVKRYRIGGPRLGGSTRKNWSKFRDADAMAEWCRDSGMAFVFLGSSWYLDANASRAAVSAFATVPGLWYKNRMRSSSSEGSWPYSSRGSA